jgi:hypothetical protein
VNYQGWLFVFDFLTFHKLSLPKLHSSLVQFWWQSNVTCIWLLAVCADKVLLLRNAASSASFHTYSQLYTNSYWNSLTLPVTNSPLSVGIFATTTQEI